MNWYDKSVKIRKIYLYTKVLNEIFVTKPQIALRSDNSTITTFYGVKWNIALYTALYYLLHFYYLNGSHIPIRAYHYILTPPTG